MPCLVLVSEAKDWSIWKLSILVASWMFQLQFLLLYYFWEWNIYYLKIKFCHSSSDNFPKFSFTEKGLVYFQGIRATWHKNFSVTATVKPSIPPNRVFSGSTFDFRWPTHILYLEGDFCNFLRNDPIMLQSQNLKPSFLLYKSSNI